MKKLGASLSSIVFEDIRGKTKENLLTGLTLNILPHAIWYTSEHD